MRTIIEMVAATRLDCVLGSASLMRRALAEASWHVAHRSAFGSLLADKPLMQNVVADLAVESEAATALAIRLAAAVDRPDDPHEAALRRIALPLAKFWVCKRTPVHGRRGAGVPGRQRVRRGVGPAAALPRGAAELGLGGLRQRQRPRRAARARRASPRCSTPGSPRSAGPAAATRAWTARSTTPSRLLGDAAAARSRRGGWPAGWRPACRARCSCGSRRRGGRRVLRLAARHGVRRHLRHAPRGRGDLRATLVERSTPHDVARSRCVLITVGRGGLTRERATRRRPSVGSAGTWPPQPLQVRDATPPRGDRSMLSSPSGELDPG